MGTPVRALSLPLSDLDQLNGIETVEDPSGEYEGRYFADGAFEEIPQQALQSATWTVRAKGRVFNPEGTHLLESRAHIRGAIRCDDWYRERCETLQDNSRARSRSFCSLLSVQRSCVIRFGCRSKQYFRWVPSQGNLADAFFSCP